MVFGGDGSYTRFAADLIDTFAGHGENGSDSADDGVLATEASFDGIYDLAADEEGSVYLTDNGNRDVRKIYKDGSDWKIRRVGRQMDPGVQPWGIAVDRQGNVYYSEFQTSGPYGRVMKIPADGGEPSVYAGGGLVSTRCTDRKDDNGFYGATEIILQSPYGLSFDDLGNLYIAEAGCHRIRKVSPAGYIETVAGSRFDPNYVGDGGPATAAGLNMPGGVAVDHDGNIFIADTMNQVIRKVDRNGIIWTIAGHGGTPGYNGDAMPATDALLAQPRDVDVDSQGNLYIADYLNHIVRVVRTDGNIYRVAGQPGVAHDYQPWNPLPDDGGPAQNATLAFPTDVIVSPQGELLIADNWNERVRRIRRWDGNTPVAGGTVLTGDDGTTLTLNADGSATRKSPDDAALADFDTHGRITSRHDPGRPAKGYTYFDDGRPQSIVEEGRAGAWTFTDDPDHCLVTSPEGDQTTIRLDGGDIVAIEGSTPDNNLSLAYLGHLLTLREEADGSTGYHYDELGRIDYVRQKDGSETSINPAQLMGVANRLVPPLGQSPSDKAPLTEAPGDACLLYMYIYDGLLAQEPVSQGTVITTGAFTVANLNDDNKNGKEDYQDSKVIGEVDLMKLRITKPKPDKGGSVTLTVKRQQQSWSTIRLWNMPTKGDGQEIKPKEVVIGTEEVGVVDFPVSELMKDIWIEVTSPSMLWGGRDIEFDLHYTGDFSDARVRASGIWVEPGEMKTSGMSLWYDCGDPVLRCFTEGGGRLGPHEYQGWFGNGVAMQFSVEPPGLGDLPEPAAKRVAFDVGQQVESKAWKKEGSTVTHVEPWKTFPGDDICNDCDVPQGKIRCENVEPKNDHLYFLDSPGTTPGSAADFLAFRANFNTFVRVRFDRIPFSNNEHAGTRSSPFKKWHSATYLRHPPGGEWKFDLGIEDGGSAGEGYISLGDPPW